jgi:hypothetical protein
MSCFEMFVFRDNSDNEGHSNGRGGGDDNSGGAGVDDCGDGNDSRGDSG